MKISTLQDFIKVVQQSVEYRRRLTVAGLKSLRPGQSDMQALLRTLQNIEQIPNQNGWKLLQLNDGRSARMDVQYETEELKKDIWYFENGEDQFREHLAGMHKEFREQTEQGLELLKGIRFRNFITDRDGTINNYCGRYSTSVQSAYNAIFLSRFAAMTINTPIILTSAPLQKPGIIDISVNPENLFIYAGSKGREFRSADGEIITLPIGKDQQKMLDNLNRKIDELLNKPEYNDFKRIGSGFQKKFGQSTVARQDINKSIPEEYSEKVLQKIRETIDGLDPRGEYFRIEDTGLDVEIILTMEKGKESRDFNKGDGILFINEKLKLELDKGPNLVCGDTASDIAMLEAAMDKSSNTRSIFVTQDEDLRRQVKQICPDACFASQPDILINILNQKAFE
ncbi:MAG: trehalose 6-phosphate synthase [Bacteroidota bacterium]|nr:trehalose 6-phosphate synthase [Bacteroidota bacterium]